MEQHLEDARQQLNASAKRYEATRRVGEVLWCEGDPAPLLLMTVQNQGVDLVVMGASGRRGMTRFLLGSVAEAVVRDAKCSVWVVRAGPAD